MAAPSYLHGQGILHLTSYILHLTSYISPAARPPAAHARVSVRVSVRVADNGLGERGQKLLRDAAGDRVELRNLDQQNS